MNCTFKSYPSHPWNRGWTFEPRNCPSNIREKQPEKLFKALETMGSISSCEEDEAWNLNIPIPENSRLALLFNGFCAYLKKKDKLYAAEVLIPAPGIIWGRIRGIPIPALSSRNNLQTEGALQWTENHSSTILLEVQENNFCLVCSQTLKEAQQIAGNYLSLDFEKAIRQEVDNRQGATHLFEEMSHHDALAVICVESMMKALRPPEGNIPHLWSQASDSTTPHLNINEICPLALAWRHINIDVAEELLLCAVKIQSNAGAIPVQFAPHTTYSTREAPKPLLAKTIETVWNTRNNHDFLESILPPLRRHLQWLLQHFDPKRRGIHYWQNRGEPLVPELYKTDIATVDLTVLLLTEIEAFNRLSKQSQQGAGESDLFIAEKKTLERNLLEQFWNEKESAFSNAFIRDVPVRAQGFSSFIPLLWPELPMFQKNVILDRIRESGTIPGGLSVLSWHKSAMDDNSFPLLQQMLVYDGLITSDPHGHMLSDFCRLTLQGFLEWHSLTIETGNDLHINPVLAAHIINIQALHQYRYYAHGGIAGFLFKFLKKTKIDRFELSVVATVLILSLSLYTANRLRKSPPPFAMLDAQMQSAYARHDATATLENCRKIIDHYPEKNDNAKLLAANILLSTSNYSEATQLLKEVRERYPDSPGPMISLGLAHQLQGDFEQAEHNYYEFCYIFEEVFPELVQEVNIYRNLIREGFKTPPKWYKIYGYQLMHEL